MGNTKKAVPETVQYRLNEETMAILATFARRAGLSVNAFAKQAMLEKIAALDSHVEMMSEMQNQLRVMGRQIHAVKNRQSLTTDVLLHMLAMSQIGDMDDLQCEAWIQENMPRTSQPKSEES